MENLKHEKEIKKMYQQPKKEKVFPHLNILMPNTFHEIDVLYFTNDDGYKYILTIIDVHNSLCDARALQNNNMEDILHALQDIYDKSPYFLYPEILQADGQFNNREMKKWCKEREIKLKITEPYMSRQNAHIERLNQTLGTILWKRQVDRELETGQKNTEWRKDYKNVIDYLNNKRLKYLDKNFKRKIEKKEDNDIIITKTNNDILNKDDKVYLILPYPEDTFGSRLQGNFRKTDPKWDIKKIYTVNNTYLIPNSVPLYEIKLGDKIIKHLKTREQLQRV
jgi:hypothetical protein